MFQVNPNSNSGGGGFGGGGSISKYTVVLALAPVEARFLYLLSYAQM